MSFAPRFSPDGQRVIMSLQQGGNSNIFVMDLRSKATTRLTDTPAIDTAPSYSPDGTRICFESDRGGTQQIYVMAANGGAGAAHQLRRRLLFDAGLVAARRLHRLHQAGAGQLRHRHHEAGRLGRAHPDRGLPQRRPDLRAERPRADVLPRPRRQRRAHRSTRSTSPAATSSAFRRRASPPIRPGRRCCSRTTARCNRAMELARPIMAPHSPLINHHKAVSRVSSHLRDRGNASIKVDGTFA